MKSLLILLLACSSLAQPRTASSSLIPAQDRAKAPGFNLTGVNGESISLSNLKGKVVLLDFWAIDCGGCQTELPWYVDFDNKYHAQGLSLIGLDMYGDAPQRIRPFLAKWNMHYPVAVGTDAIGDSYGLKEMPLTILIDRKGRVALSHAGVVDRNAFESAIQALLKEQP